MRWDIDTRKAWREMSSVKWKESWKNREQKFKVFTTAKKLKGVFKVGLSIPKMGCPDGNFVEAWAKLGMGKKHNRATNAVCGDIKLQIIATRMSESSEGEHKSRSEHKSGGEHKFCSKCFHCDEIGHRICA